MTSVIVRLSANRVIERSYRKKTKMIRNMTSPLLTLAHSKSVEAVAGEDVSYFSQEHHVGWCSSFLFLSIERRNAKYIYTQNIYIEGIIHSPRSRRGGEDFLSLFMFFLFWNAKDPKQLRNLCLVATVFPFQFCAITSLIFTPSAPLG